ncbi:MAG: hypothetical protein ABI658_31515 [Acidimicrobiales bacterium]
MTDTPAPSAAPLVTAQPTDQLTPSSSPWVPCGPQILVGDSTGQLLSCEDIGTVGIVSVAPHVANIPADPAQVRIWWTVETCATTWWLDIHDGASGVTVIDLKDGDHPACPTYTVGRALTLVFRPMVSASDVVQLHNGVPVISTWPVSTPPTEPMTYPSTPASIQFGRWEVAHHEHLTRDSTEIHVLVFERACSSGQSPEGRILEPFVAYDKATVWIEFGIWSLPGVQSCEPGPGVPYTVLLRDPLGRRHIEERISDDGFGGPFITWADCPSGSPQIPC